MEEKNGFSCSLALLLSYRNAVHFLRQAQFIPIPTIPLGQPLAGLDQLDDIDPLLEQHDGSAGDGEHPWDSGAHFVGSGHFHGRGAERAGEEERGRGLKRGGRGRIAGPFQRRGDLRRAEAKEIEGDEEEFVERAGDEENRLEWE